MAMGQDDGQQPTLFLTYDKLRGLGHPFYDALDRLLRDQGFNRFVEGLCAPFYAEVMGRPGLAPGVYFRCLLVGYFEGISSERGIAWRVADSLSLRRFLGLNLERSTPDHSTIVGLTLHGGAAGDTKTIEETLTTADANLEEVRQEGSQAAKEQLAERVEEVVADKGYHSNDVLTKLEEVGVRSYIPEPARGRRNWKNKDAERDAVRRNQRRIKRKKGKALQRKRSELVERPFLHAAGFNLGLVMRKMYGVGKPRALQGLRAAPFSLIVAALTLIRWLGRVLARIWR